MPATSSTLPGGFSPTRWTLVLRAQGGTDAARTALKELCAGCYEPVHQFLLRTGWPPDTARDLAHSFFAAILQRGDIGTPDPARGRFRAWLLGAVKHFAADARKAASRQKRGGGIEPLPIHEGPDIADERATPSDAVFDRGWALALMNRAAAALEHENTAAGRSAEFAILKAWITGAPAMSQAAAAQRAGMTEGAVKVAIHRLRKRFRELLRAEVLQTLHDPSDCEDELRYLREALGS